MSEYNKYVSPLSERYASKEKVTELLREYRKHALLFSLLQHIFALFEKELFRLTGCKSFLRYIEFL